MPAPFMTDVSVDLLAFNRLVQPEDGLLTQGESLIEVVCTRVAK